MVKQKSKQRQIVNPLRAVYKNIVEEYNGTLPKVFLGDQRQMIINFNIIIVLSTFGINLSNYFHYKYPPGELNSALQQIIGSNMGQQVLVNTISTLCLLIVINLVFYYSDKAQKNINIILIVLGILITILTLELELKLIHEVPPAPRFGFFYFRGIQLAFTIFILMQMITNWMLTIPLCFFIWFYYGIRIFAECCNMHSWITMSITTMICVPYIEYCKQKYIKNLFSKYQQKVVSEDSLIRLMNILPQGVAYFNFQGELQMFNQSCLKVLSIQKQDQIKQNMNNIQKSIFQQCKQLIERSQNTQQQSLSSSLQIILSERKKKFNQCNQNIYETCIQQQYIDICIQDDIYQDERRFVVIFNDITQSIKYLQEINEYKSQLISTVSHELRTPLNNSMCMLELALDEETIPQLQKEQLLKPAYFSSKILMNIINDILDFSRMNAQKLKLNFMPVNIRKVINDVQYVMNFQITKKNLDFLVDIKSLEEVGEEVIFYTDENRLVQILLNLLSNAVKFTLKGYIKLSVNFQQEDRSKLYFSVEDSGVGIASEDQHQLFNVFSKVDKIENQHLNPLGAGLGLTISDKLVKMMKMRNTDIGLEMYSQYHQGSKFWFQIDNMISTSFSLLNIPIEFPEDNNQQIQYVYSSITTKINQNVFQPPKIKKNKKTISIQFVDKIIDKCQCPQILLVDDNEFNLYALEKVLGKKNILYSKAYNGAEAIDIVKIQITKSCGCFFKGILMDCQMPILDGFQTSQILNQMMKNQDIPYIPIAAFTAHALDEDLEKCKNSGMTLQLIKPVSLRKLEYILKEMKIV